MEIEPIGIIRTPFRLKDQCPMQPRFASGLAGRVEVFEESAAGLEDIQAFSRIYLIYHFDRAAAVKTSLTASSPPGIPADPPGSGSPS